LRRARRKQGPFEGSTRQVRGAIARALRARGSSTIDRLVAETGFGPDRIVPAVAALTRDGIVSASPAALAGSPRGRVRLPD
jgi:hypothetical protein